jgi:allantoin racemase
LPTSKGPLLEAGVRRIFPLAGLNLIIAPNCPTRILYINPVGTKVMDAAMLRELRAAAAKGTEVDLVSLERGPEHVEYHYYESLVLADVLHKVKEAENDGYDAAVLGCFYDLGLQESRELSEHMVITAPAESAMLLACSLGYRFSIIVGRRKWIPQMHDTAVRYGLKDRLASFRAVNMGVLDFQKDHAKTSRAQIEEGRKAVELDGAEVIILGCTAEFGFWRKLQKELGVPVLDPIITPLKYAEHLVTLRDLYGWSHSKAGSYESPPLREIQAWKLGEKYGTDVWEQTGQRG